MQADDIAKVLGTLGLGTAGGAALTAWINAQSSRGKSRAEAADLLVGAAERVGKMNQDMDSEIRKLRNHLDTIKIAMLHYLAEDISREELLGIVKELLNDDT